MSNEIYNDHSYELKNIMHYMVNKKYMIVLIIIISHIILYNNAFAEDINDSWHGVEVKFNKNKNNGKEELVTTIDKDEMLNSYSFWKKVGGLRPEATETDFRSKPYTYGAGFAVYSITGSLHGDNAKFDGNPLKVIGEIIQPDLYGHKVAHQIFSFTFTKKINDKIDWEGFDAMSFQKIAPDFHWTPWFETQYRTEPLK